MLGYVIAKTESPTKAAAASNPTGAEPSPSNTDEPADSSLQVATLAARALLAGGVLLSWLEASETLTPAVFDPSSIDSA
jgi:hypothetical protein